MSTETRPSGRLAVVDVPNQAHRRNLIGDWQVALHLHPAVGSNARLITNSSLSLVHNLEGFGIQNRPVSEFRVSV